MSRRTSNLASRHKISILPNEGKHVEGPYYVPSIIEEIAMTRPNRFLHFSTDTKIDRDLQGKIISLNYQAKEGSYLLGHYKVAKISHLRDSFGLNKNMTYLGLVWLPRKSNKLDHTFRFIVDDKGDFPIYQMAFFYEDRIEFLFEGQQFKCVDNDLVSID